MWPLSRWSLYVNTAEATVACVSLWSCPEGFLQKTALRKASTLSPQALYLPSLRPRLINSGVMRPGRERPGLAMKDHASISSL